MDEIPELPEHFDDAEVLLILRKGSHAQLRKQYPLTCGLALKLRTSYIRVIKRSLLKGVEKKALGTEDACLYELIEAFTSEKDFLREQWPDPLILHSVVVEISVKAINLSPPLHRELCLHPLGIPKYIVSQGVPSEGFKTTTVELNGIKYALADADLRGPNTVSGEHTRVSVQFNRDFLRRVKEYHDSTQRPAGTFEDPTKASPVKSPFKAPEKSAEEPEEPKEDDEAYSNYIRTLAALPKETCAKCSGHRQIYCGHCAGLRMPQGDKLLPPRLRLPFDVLLVVHWAETLHKCTGVHVGVLCDEGTFQTAEWEKTPVPTVPFPPCNSQYNQSAAASSSGVPETPSPAPLREQWKQTVESLDHTRDVVLFPCDAAQQAETFPWTDCPHISQSSESTTEKNSSPPFDKQQRWRLVVLEANWTYGKGMAQQLRQHRAAVGLPPLRFVQLTDITGQYWKFQTVGHSAVSTIEAIAHTAGAAGVGEEVVGTLLTLFYLQKHRVLQRIELGGKAPRAIEVSGAGLGSWKELTDSLAELE